MIFKFKDCFYELNFTFEPHQELWNNGYRVQIICKFKRFCILKYYNN